MPKIGEPDFSGDAPCLARKYERWMDCMHINFIAYKKKNDKTMASYLYDWIGQKGRMIYQISYAEMVR